MLNAAPASITQRMRAQVNIFREDFLLRRERLTIKTYHARDLYKD